MTQGRDHEAREPDFLSGGFMTGFDQAWLAVAKARNGEPVSPRLRPLLEAVYHQSLAHPLDSSKLKKNLEDLLLFLSGEGRCNANCWAADLFFAQSEAWERDWAELNLPEGLHDVLAMMGEALHDTIQAPEIAKNFLNACSNCLILGKRRRRTKSVYSVTIIGNVEQCRTEAEIRDSQGAV